MTQIELARQVLLAAGRAGVREIIICAGARNAPFIQLLAEARGVRTYSFFEERGAGFFAIGRMQDGAGPVAVITTSGTAVAELLAPVIEADHQGLPLIVISADRPRSFRGSGAPQSILQPGIFSHFVERGWDLEGEFSDTFTWSKRRPIHVNICLKEPLLDAPVPAWDWPALSTHVQVESVAPNSAELVFKNPLVLIGGLNPSEHEFVKERVEAWGTPVYAEGTSQLRGQFAREILRPRDVEYDSIIRIGAVPTLRLWRDLEISALPIGHFSGLPWRGLSRPQNVEPLAALKNVRVTDVPRELPATVAQSCRRLNALFERYPRSEPAWVNWVSRQMPNRARVFLGNSLPIREWDLSADFNFRGQVFANRGVNGIDGLLSTALGVATTTGHNWALLGDLSTLYDLSGPWALRERPINYFSLVVINNGGGKIFERIFANPRYENRHALNFKSWAEMWNLEYREMQTPGVLEVAARPRVIEIVPSPKETAEFWREWES